MTTELQCPDWVRSYLDSDGITRIEAAIVEVEQQTSGEIVPMIVSRSSAVGHVGPAFGLTLAFLWTAVAIVMPGVFIPYWLFSGVPIILAGAIFFKRKPCIERLFTSASDRDYQVTVRAEIERLQAKMTTKKKTGVLIFASLMERRGVVLVDQAIADRLPQETWAEVVGLLIGGLQNKDAASGFIAAIKRTGEILAEHFPPAADDQDEISNYLRIKD